MIPDITTNSKYRTQSQIRKDAPKDLEDIINDLLSINKDVQIESILITLLPTLPAGCNYMNSDDLTEFLWPRKYTFSNIDSLNTVFKYFADQYEYYSILEGMVFFKFTTGSIQKVALVLEYIPHLAKWSHV